VWHGENGTIIAVIGDGAGSASHAQRGSYLATRGAARFLQKRLWSNPDLDPAPLLIEAFDHARWAIEDEARLGSDDGSLALRSFATTLVVAVSTPSWFAAAQRGDGAVVVRNESGELLTVVPPQNGTYANQTYFVTDLVDQLVTEVKVMEPVKSFALMTDGLTELALFSSDARPHDAFFEPIERFVSESRDRIQASRQLGEFLTSARVNSRTDDDKTLYLAVRQPDWIEGE
jgi:hypothetical protein